jgi:hypothetical protein
LTLTNFTVVSFHELRDTVGGAVEGLGNWSK